MSKASNSHQSSADSRQIAQAYANAGVNEELHLKMHWTLSCYRYDVVRFGILDGPFSVGEYDNIVVTVGKNWILANAFSTGTLFVGITQGSPTFNAADTMASHSGWVKVSGSNFSQTTWPAFTQGSVSAGACGNSASTAAFSITTNGTIIGGTFITTIATLTDTTGVLICGGANSQGDQTIGSGGSITAAVTLTLT